MTEKSELQTTSSKFYETKKTSRLERKTGVFDKIKAFFPYFEKQSKEAALVGRIHAELKKDAHELIIKLNKLKNSFKKELEENNENQLWSSFEAVLNPLLREYIHIERKLMEPTDSLVTNTSAIKSYNDWIVKAKLWVALCSRPHDRDSIIGAVITHTIEVSDEIIDRDLKTLEDYKLHEVQNAGLDFTEIEEIVKKIDQEIAPHLQELHALKHQKPSVIKLELLSSWKAEIDEARAKHYEEALHIIDTLIKSVAPIPMVAEDQEHLREIFERMAYLEEELPIFQRHLKRVDVNDLVVKQMLEGQLAYLEEEAHKVNSDLRLTPELIDRINVVLKALSEAHQYF